MGKSGRKSLSEPTKIKLLAQARSSCPKCDLALFYQKNGRTNGHYEIAHIYPLNPTKEEAELLKDEERLGDGDPNHEDNLIPLCPNCHTIFDKPRTIDEYRSLLSIKKEFIHLEDRISLYRDSTLEKSIGKVINLLYLASEEDLTSSLNYNAKTIDNKINNDIQKPTIRKIKHNVSDYYEVITNHLKALETTEPNSTTIIATQVRAFFLQLRRKNFSKQQIYYSIVDWIKTKTKSENMEAAEILTSYYIQNCEIFE
ncbi:MAG: HNH endonuclease signature motif containing protein [Verrucomicrobiota bacterium JB022]|nr:HNH endonuclease signature motif containing protein [Verrucomicrobiota bacterium JB022]